MSSLLLLLTLLSAPQADEPVVLGKRTAILTFTVVDDTGVNRKYLWVSTDGKRTWQRAKTKDEGEAEGRAVVQWHELEGSKLTATLTFPSDGEYYLHLQLGDEVTNLSPVPTEGARHDLHVRVRSAAAEGGPMILQPRPADRVVAGSRIVVVWETKGGGFQTDSAALYYRFHSTAWKEIAASLPLTGSQEWTVPAAQGTGLWLRVSVRNEKGRETAFDAGEIVVQGGVRPGKPVLLDPRGGEAWEGGRAVKLRWAAGEGTVMERSASLYYAVGEGPWQAITRGLENTGFYLWSPPLQATDRLRIQVRMRTADGIDEIESDPSGNVRVDVRVRGDKRRAMGHYDRARVLHAQRRSAEAVAEYEKAIEAWPDYPEALHELGRLYYEESEHARALEFFLRARSACPSAPQPYVNTAMAQMKLGLSAEGFQDLKDAVDLGVDRDRLLAVTCGEKLMELAVQFLAGNRQDLAVDALQNVLRIRHADPRVRAKAKEYLEWTLEGSPKSEARSPKP